MWLVTRLIAPAVSSSASTPAAPPSAGTVPDAQRLAAQLAALAERDDAEGFRAWLELLRILLGARAVAWLDALGEAGELPDCVVGRESAGSLAALRGVLDPAKTMVLPAPQLGAEGYTLAAPVVREGAQRGWLAAQLIVPSARDLQAFAALLQAAAGYLLYRAERRAGAALHDVLARTSGLLEVFRQAGSEHDFTKACAMAVEALRDYLGCSRLSLGYAARGRAVRMQAISGLTKIDPKSAAHQPFEAAMREAIALGERVEFTAASPRTDHNAAHEVLQQQTGARRIVTVPLAHRRGAVLMEWTGEQEPARLAEAASPFLAVLFDLLERARPNPAQFAAQRFWARLSRQRRRAALAAAAALALLLAWPFHYPIRSDCRLAPTTKQVVAAPFAGQLRKSHVRPGDAVQAGQPLGELDNRELKLKEAELLAGRERALKQRDRALSGADGEGADFSSAQVANFEAQSIGQELELVRQKLALLEVASPLAGVVVSGDLRRAEGQPVQQGQVLWEVAPLDRMIVEVEVPDREISRVRAGLPVTARLEAFSGERWRSAIEKVHPQSELRDGVNVFICEASIENAVGAELRPGMRGRATIEGDRRPLLWILGHRLWEWVVTTIFW